jgi:hypothetical protein
MKRRPQRNSCTRTENPCTRKSTKVNQKPEGGRGALSSPGICIASLLNMPNSLSVRLSCDEILDLSHPEIFYFSMRSPVPGAMCLVSLVRRGMMENWWSRERKRKMSAGGARGRRRTDAGADECVAQRRGKMRHRAIFFRWKTMRLNRWMKRRGSWILRVLVR